MQRGVGTLQLLAQQEGETGTTCTVTAGTAFAFTAFPCSQMQIQRSETASTCSVVGLEAPVSVHRRGLLSEEEGQEAEGRLQVYGLESCAVVCDSVCHLAGHVREG